MDDQSPKRVCFVGGPCNGYQNVNGTLQEVVPISLDANFQATDDPQPTWLAIYQIDTSVPEPQYNFLHVQDTEGSTFLVEFVGGPLHGLRPFPHPAAAFLDEAFLPLDEALQLFSGKGDPIAAAIYAKRQDGGVCRLHFIRLDRTTETLDEYKAAVREQKRLMAIREFYVNPRDSIYSCPPTGEHKEVFIEHGHRKASVDEGIAPLILELWKMDLDTLGSCQHRAEGFAYVGFPIADHGRKFMQILTDSGIEFTEKSTKFKINRAESPDSEAIESLEFDSMNVRFSPDSIESITRALVERYGGHRRSVDTSPAHFVVIEMEGSEHDSVKLQVLGIIQPDYEYQPHEVVQIDAIMDEVSWSPQPESATPLNNRRAIWGGREFQIETAYLKEHVGMVLVLTPLEQGD